jgi:hypothetical protein
MLQNRTVCTISIISLIVFWIELEQSVQVQSLSCLNSGLDKYVPELSRCYIDDPIPTEFMFENDDDKSENESYSIPSHVQTSGGSKWSKNPGDSTTWSIVPMTDSDHRGRYKVVDLNGKNIAANFVSHEEAQQYIDGTG